MNTTIEHFQANSVTGMRPQHFKQCFSPQSYFAYSCFIDTPMCFSD